jgi:DNA-binding transcriptional MerR regulator
MSQFTRYYKGILFNEQEYFFTKSSNEALTIQELKDAQKLIRELQQKGLPSAKIIAKLQDWNAKLTEKYRAERVFFTEVKREESQQIAEAGENLELDKYRVILSPHACEKCIDISKNGKRIYNQDEIADSKEIPPYHPNCYCALIPM